MFHRVSRSTSFETSHRRLGGLRWGIVAVLVLVAIGASTAALAAGPSSASANVTHLALLKVVPKNVGIPGDGINCKGIDPKVGSVCHVTLTEVKSASKSLHWCTRSDFPAKFSPSSGSLSPGQSVQVTITTKFCGGYTNFYFVGPKNVATVTFQCG